MGRMFIVFCFSLALLTLLFHYNISFDWVGTLPGDITVTYQKMKVFVPFTTSIIVSFALSIFLWIFGKK